MKKLLLTMAMLATAGFASAQSTSVITGSGSNTSSLGKSDNIKGNVTGSLGAVETAASNWNTEVVGATSNLKESTRQIKLVIDKMIYRQEEFFETETDPKDGSYQDHATKAVPICHGSKPRLIYKSNKWQCAEPIDCGQVNSGQDNWYQDASGKCVRRRGIWKVGGWVNRSTTQTRTVTCVEEGTNASLGTNQCSTPKPLTSRPRVS